MGRPKATLPFGPELMLPRVVRILSEVVEPVVVVAAPEQLLPPIPHPTRCARDAVAGRGPLEGLAAGLSALQGIAEAAFVTSCDVPLLRPEFVRELIRRLGDHEIVVPVEGGYQHPLAAVYRVRLLPVVHRLLASDRLRPAFLFDEVPTCRVDAQALRSVDPALQSLRNVNCWADYLSALEAAGLQPGEP